MSRNIPILTLLIIALAVGCKTKKATPKMPPLQVKVAMAREDQNRGHRTFSSEIEPLYKVKIEPRVDGYLASMPFNDGMPVEKNQLIFTLEPASIATALFSAKAQHYSAQAERVKAQNNYDRALPLSRINAISKSDMDQYRASLAAAEAAMRSAEAAMRSAELDMSYTRIKAPISGIIARSAAQVGDFVGPSTLFSELTSISYIDTVTVDIAIPTSQYFEAMQGGDMSDSNLLTNITIQLSDSTYFPHQGRYYYTKRDASQGSSTVVIVAKFPNPNHTLKPNMFTRVKCAIGAPRKAIIIPQKAVQQMQGISSVWLVKADSTVTQRRVELGATYGEDWIITSGIAPGEQVLTSGQIKMHEGEKVKPIKE